MQEMEQLISVIVPIYNVEQYLKKCIESILKQTYQNLEIILVDDGSPDGCGAICDTYAKKDDRIKVIHKANGGLSDARNAGLEVATGEYVLMVDSDDWIHNQTIEILYRTIQEQDADVSICNYQYVHTDDKYKDEKYDFDQLKAKIEWIDNREIQYRYFTDQDRRIMYTVAWNKLYRRSLWKDIRYPKGKVHEDEYTTFKVLYAAHEIGIIDLPLNYYFVGRDSIMSVFKPSRFDIFDGYLEKIRCYLMWNEDELASKVWIHAVHMMAQYQLWMEEAKTEHTELRKKYCKKLVQIFKQNKNKIQLSTSQKMEKMLFRMNFTIYYTFWKLARK